MTKAMAPSMHPCHCEQLLTGGKVGANNNDEGQGRMTTPKDNGREMMMNHRHHCCEPLLTGWRVRVIK